MISDVSLEISLLTEDPANLDVPANEGYEKSGLIVKDETDNTTSDLLGFNSTGTQTLPSGVKYRLTYNADSSYTDYNAEGFAAGVHDRFGNTT